MNVISTLSPLSGAPGSAGRTVPVREAGTSEPSEPTDRLELGSPADAAEEPVPFRWAGLALAALAVLGAAPGVMAATGAPVASLAVVVASRDARAEARSLPPTLWEKPLQQGSTGEQVRRFAGYLGEYVPVTPTDRFDSSLEEAVKAFQRQNNLPADGVVGETTMGVLFTRLFWEKGIAASLNGPELSEGLPKDVRVVVDLSKQRAFLVDPATGQAVRAYPVSTGSSEFPTPQRSFKVSHRHEKPSWTPPASEWARGQQRREPGPTNPLGPVALRLSGSTILMHGVPVSSFRTLGRSAASHGCIRMFPQHIHELSQVLKVGTRVDVVGRSSLEVPGTATGR